MTEKDQIRQAQALLTVRENLVHQIECIRIGAVLQRAKFVALVKEGFTEEQAIFLCK